jgi:hypothetical protein
LQINELAMPPGILIDCRINIFRSLIALVAVSSIWCIRMLPTWLDAWRDHDRHLAGAAGSWIGFLEVSHWQHFMLALRCHAVAAS